MACEGCARRKESLRKLGKRVDQTQGKAELALVLAAVALFVAYSTRTERAADGSPNHG